MDNNNNHDGWINGFYFNDDTQNSIVNNLILQNPGGNNFTHQNPNYNNNLFHNNFFGQNSANNNYAHQDTTYNNFIRQYYSSSNFVRQNNINSIVSNNGLVNQSLIGSISIINNNDNDLADQVSTNATSTTHQSSASINFVDQNNYSDRHHRLSTTEI
ncbi:16215_t:CDS:1 [Entrophospora sp. SA101]|nr:3390_t:CDS:1 [Entrophospora sp. SA101]CAJ0648922.1 16215_t:CDS:1 [Entrophospora sp. SA101]CAJ0888052.1 5538_t:CDS:1 [Entrophospora sp. SA101]